MAFDLQRFIKAQDEGGSYEQALKELFAGEKTGHWMWYVFPQLRGLGRSEIATFYGIIGKAEAKAYWADKTLCGRYKAAVNAINQVRGKSAADIFGPVDAMKLRSSLTLFYIVSGKDEVIRKALARFFDEKLDQKTMDML